MKQTQMVQAVDAVIEDNKGNIVLIKRTFPPFVNFYALPGGFIEKGENAKRTVIREVKEETNLDVEVIKKIGFFDKEGRDPRGKVVSTVYKCKIIGDASKARPEYEKSGVYFFSKEQLKNLDLAFDHEDILATYFKKSR
jgi:ADP-ribose pyrophosphatase YjhB (NUDIX family)